jgi:hypothetical protein
MQLDTTQNNIQLNTTFTDSISFQATDSSILNTDSLNHQSEVLKDIGRFITEKDLIGNITDQIKTHFIPEWITYLIFAGFVLLAVLNFFHRKRLLQSFRAVFSMSQTNLFIREGNPFRKRATLFLALIYSIAIPLLFYFSVEYFISESYGITLGPPLLFRLLILVFGFFIYKILFIQFTAVIFQTQKTSFELLINILIFNLVSGVLILPTITLFVYTQLNIFLYIGLFIYGIGISIRLFRELTVGMTHSIFSVLHLFLYLCTLEFIPIIIVVKMLINFYTK